MKTGEGESLPLVIWGARDGEPGALETPRCPRRYSIHKRSLHILDCDRGFNARHHREPDMSAIRWMPLLGFFLEVFSVRCPVIQND